ncbi:MAG: hypothetical protein ACLP56_03680, partial [Candidatus Sulfotelmatobacter sp.]
NHPDGSKTDQANFPAEQFVSEDMILSGAQDLPIPLPKAFGKIGHAEMSDLWRSKSRRTG